jgi:cobalt-zinc-cadmium efflux system protein
MLSDIIRRRALAVIDRSTPLERRYVWALALTALILIAEVAGGILTGSLALLSDAAHILLDVLALGMSYAALRVAARPADDRHTYGFHRWQVLVALANGLTLLVVAYFICREAVGRLREPEPILAGPMLAVAAVGLLVNLVVLRILHDHDREDLNTRSAFLHVLGDALSSIGVLAAGAVILLTGWTAADPLASILIGGVILVGAWRVLKEAMHILVEGTPEGIGLTEVRAAIQGQEGVIEVHDLHIWSVSPGYVALSAHVTTAECSLADAQAIQKALRTLLAERFHIAHSTLQLECAACGHDPAGCGPAQARPAGGH